MGRGRPSSSMLRRYSGGIPLRAVLGDKVDEGECGGALGLVAVSYEGGASEGMFVG